MCVCVCVCQRSSRYLSDVCLFVCIDPFWQRIQVSEPKEYEGELKQMCEELLAGDKYRKGTEESDDPYANVAFANVLLEVATSLAPTKLTTTAATQTEPSLPTPPHSPVSEVSTIDYNVPAYIMSEVNIFPHASGAS